MNITDHFSEFFGLKMFKFFYADLDPGSGAMLTLDPGYGMEKFGSGINIPDPRDMGG
jgi:hypothetical protein